MKRTELQGRAARHKPMVSLLETVPIPLPPAPSEPQFYGKGRAEKSNSFTARPGSLETEHWQSKWQSHQAWGSFNLRLSSCSGLAIDQKTSQDLLGVLRDETTPVPLINSLQTSQLDQILHRHHRHHARLLPTERLSTHTKKMQGGTAESKGQGRHENCQKFECVPQIHTQIH